MVIGIDVAKDKVDVHLRPSAETFTVANDEAGLRESWSSASRR